MGFGIKALAVPAVLIFYFLSAGNVRGSLYLTESFDSYVNGGLNSQGFWVQTGSTSTNPIQISGATDKYAVLISNGQDLNRPLFAPVPHADGSSIDVGFDLIITSPQATGDYFIHLSPSSGSTTSLQKIYAKSTSGGYLLGIADSIGTPVYGTGVLTSGTEYHISIAWKFIAADLNDSFSLYVNPASPIQGTNTPYLTTTWDPAGSLEPSSLGAINIRQGAANNAPSAQIDNLVVASTFAEVIPEPASLSMLSITGIALLARRRVPAMWDR